MSDTATYEKIKWPNNAKCAVMLSFDVDGDTIWKNGSRELENGDQYIRANSVGNYGPKHAVARILEILDKEEVKETFFIPAKIKGDYPLLCQAIDKRGHEIGHHGYHHERYVDLSPERQRQIITESQAVFAATIGKEAIGYRTPSGDWSEATPGILHEMGLSRSEERSVVEEWTTWGR